MTRFLVVAVLMLLGAVPAAAQEPFPSRTVTIVNPYPPGGQADLSGRPFAAALATVLKQPVIIANKPGAAGAVGMQSVAVAKPDGYTLLITVPSLHTPDRVEKLSAPATYQDADEFKPWLDVDAARLADDQEDREGRVSPAHVESAACSARPLSATLLTCPPELQHLVVDWQSGIVCSVDACRARRKSWGRKRQSTHLPYLVRR